MITQSTLTQLYDNQTPVALLDGKTGEVLTESALVVGATSGEFYLEDTSGNSTKYFALKANDARYCPERGRVYFENYIHRI